MSAPALSAFRSFSICTAWRCAHHVANVSNVSIANTCRQKSPPSRGRRQTCRCTRPSSSVHGDRATWLSPAPRLPPAMRSRHVSRRAIPSARSSSSTPTRPRRRPAVQRCQQLSTIVHVRVRVGRRSELLVTAGRLGGGNLTRTCCSCRASRPGGPGPSRETAHCADAPQSCHLRPRPPLLNLPLPVAIRRDALPLECCRMAPRLSRCSGRGWHRVSRASHNTFKHNTQKRVVSLVCGP